MLSKIIDSLNKSEVIDKNGYKYFINPLTDGIPALYPDLINEAVDWIVHTTNMEEIDKIVTMEAMGIPIAIGLSYKTGIPINIIRKKSYGRPGEYLIIQKTGYSTTKMYINGIDPGDGVMVFDVIVSTGGTMRAVLEGLSSRFIDATIVDIVSLIEKNEGIKKLRDIGWYIRTGIRVNINNGKAEAKLSESL